MTAARLCCGLSVVTGDVVLPVPVGRIVEDPLVGMAVRRDDGGIVGASRVLLLVRGAGGTTMEPIDGEKQLSDQTFKVTSTAAECLLSDAQAQVDLVGYCDFNKMLTYRLDKEAALVLVSAVACGEPGSASSPSAGGGARPIATIEHMPKLSKDDVAALERNLAVE